MSVISIERRRRLRHAHRHASPGCGPHRSLFGYCHPCHGADERQLRARLGRRLRRLYLPGHRHRAGHAGAAGAHQPCDAPQRSFLSPRRRGFAGVCLGAFPDAGSGVLAVRLRYGFLLVHHLLQASRHTLPGRACGGPVSLLQAQVSLAHGAAVRCRAGFQRGNLLLRFPNRHRSSAAFFCHAVAAARTAVFRFA